MMSSAELRKILRNIAKSHLADYNEMKEVSCHYMIKLKAS